jgi:hypothetical protein
LARKLHCHRLDFRRESKSAERKNDFPASMSQHASMTDGTRPTFFVEAAMKNPSQADSLPSPDQIRNMTAEIRKGWTPREYRKRAGLARSFIEIQLWAEPTLRVTRTMNQSV